MATINSLIVFVRNPELGKVKTRLAAGVGERRALDIYLELLRHTRAITLELPVNRYVYYSHFIDDQDEWAVKDFQKRLQTGHPDLGIKMKTAFEEVLKEVDKAVIIGSDCPKLTPAHLREAFNALGSKEVVLGPAVDGGYYLLGLSKMVPQLFEDMKWSTPHVAENTLQRIRQLNLAYHLLPTLPDIDYAEDWIQYGWEF